MTDLLTTLNAFKEHIDENVDAFPLEQNYQLLFVGESQVFSLSVFEQRCLLEEGLRNPERCALGLYQSDLQDLISGVVTMQALVASGRLRIFGNIGDAMKLEAIF